MSVDNVAGQCLVFVPGVSAEDHVPDAAHPGGPPGLRDGHQDRHCQHQQPHPGRASCEFLKII